MMIVLGWMLFTMKAMLGLVLMCLVLLIKTVFGLFFYI